MRENFQVTHPSHGEEIGIVRVVGNPYTYVRFSDDLYGFPTSEYTVVAEEATVSRVKQSNRHRFPDLESRYSDYDPTKHGVPVDIEHPEYRPFCEFLKKHGQMVIGCTRAKKDQAIAYFLEKGIENPANFLRVGKSDLLGGVWVNVFFPDPGVDGLDESLHIFFNARGLKSSGLYQAHRTEFGLSLLPEIHLLSIEEKIQPLEKE